MPFNPDIHHRRSVRLLGWDYSSPGVYYITICTHRRECLFGGVITGEMRLNQFGDAADACWRAITDHTQCIELDEWVVMPNHIHGLIVILDTSVGARHAVPLHQSQEVFGKPKPDSLSTVVRSFKSAVTRQINTLRNTSGAPVWQRSFYDHIVRTQSDIDQIRLYIPENPMQWHMDSENPDNW